MDAELILVPEAEQDISDAYAWYEQQRIGLGEEFLSCVEACIETILRNPEMYKTIHRNYRRGLVRRFPYAIFYEFEEETVTIYGIFHTSRDPAKWRKRISDQ